MANWDYRFLVLARHISSWSKDPSSKIGSVIVRPDRTIASVGFNGFARGLSDDVRRYADRDFKIATILHAEENAILSSRERLNGYTIYVSGLPPCAKCAGMIIQSGLQRVVHFDLAIPERWQDNIDLASSQLTEAGVEITSLNEAEVHRVTTSSCPE